MWNTKKRWVSKMLSKNEKGNSQGTSLKKLQMPKRKAFLLKWNFSHLITLVLVAMLLTFQCTKAWSLNSHTFSKLRFEAVGTCSPRSYMKNLYFSIASLGWRERGEAHLVTFEIWDIGKAIELEAFHLQNGSRNGFLPPRFRSIFQ